LGGISVGVPGSLSALYQAHQKYGKLPWKQLFAPAIKLAKNGYPLTNKTVANLQKYPHLKQFADMAVYYDHQKNPKPVGTVIKNLILAKTLTTIANQGIKPFYQGEIAKKIVDKVQNSVINPGLLELADLKNYKTTSGSLLCSTYRSYKICTMPPSSSGITVLQTLGILENFDLSKYQPNSASAIHLIAEATKLAYADRNQYVYDSTSVPTSQMLDKQYLKQRASLINLKKAQPKISYGVFDNFAVQPTGKNIDKSSTTHLVVLDKHKNAVSMTSSIEYTFGAGITAEGFFLNNQLTDFSMVPTDEKGNLVANRVLPNHRPRSSMSPLIAVLDWQLNVEQAVSLPNFIALNAKLELEKNTEIVGLSKQLKKLGHQVEIAVIPSGLQAFYIDYNTNKIYGSADYRRNGVAIGE
jgi:gamma-glutamyltranspeptidase/glutathione hydrolase